MMIQMDKLKKNCRFSVSQMLHHHFTMNCHELDYPWEHKHLIDAEGSYWTESHPRDHGLC